MSLVARWLLSVVVRSLLVGLAASLLIAEPAAAQRNPITSFTRLWGEWDVVPNTQWAPKAVDPSAQPDRSIQIFKFQPVVPFRLNDDWTVLTRTIFRFISLPTADPLIGLSPAGGPALLGWDQRSQAGLADISPTAFLVPDLGPDVTIGLGSSLVVRGLLRYQLNPDWYLISSPIIAADWTQSDGKGWVVPVGGGVGRSFRLAGQPMQVSVEGYYNAVKPQVLGEELLGDWTIRTQWQILFPN